MDLVVGAIGRAQFAARNRCGHTCQLPAIAAQVSANAGARAGAHLHLKGDLVVCIYIYVLYMYIDICLCMYVSINKYIYIHLKGDPVETLQSLRIRTDTHTQANALLSGTDTRVSVLFSLSL